MAGFLFAARLLKRKPHDMSNLKRWMLVPLAVVIGAIVLLILLTVLSVKVGFLWALLIMSVAMVLGAFALASRFEKQTAEKVSGGVLFAVICIWGVVGVANVTTWMTGSGTASQKESTDTYSDAEVYIEARGIVDQFLKAPSTAKHAPISQVKIKRSINNSFRVDGYVDSQNSFGAMLRSDWIVQFRFTENDKLEVHLVKIGDTVVYRNDPE